MGVEIVRSSDTPACTVRITGDMDLSLVPAIRAAVDGVVSTSCSHVVLDLSGVTYADSSALSLLVWMDRRVHPLGGKVVLAGADRNVSRVLELSGLVGLAPSIVMASDAEHALDGLVLPPLRDEPAWEQSLTVPARVEEMSGVRTRVCDIIAPLRMPETSLYDLKVALGEALANAMRHGSPAGESDEVTVNVYAYDDRVVVEVLDSGSGFDGVSDSDDDVYASGGRGILFMRALTDGVEFMRREGGGTAVRLTKRLDGQHGTVTSGRA